MWWVCYGCGVVGVFNSAHIRSHIVDMYRQSIKHDMFNRCVLMMAH